MRLRNRSRLGCQLAVLILILGLTGTVAACSEGQRQPQARYPETRQSLVYECEAGRVFPVRLERNLAWVFLPEKTLRLVHVPSGSGARYQQGDSVFWSKGETATLETGDQIYRNCHNNRARAIWEDAKMRGVEFRAVGNEPGWYLEISNATDLLLVTDFGNERHMLNLQILFIDAHQRRTEYHAKHGKPALHLVIEGVECRDTMSGETFEATVSVTLENRTYQGCGRSLH